MAFTNTDHFFTGQSSGSSTASVTPVIWNQHDLLVVFVTYSAGGTVSSVTDDSGGALAWTRIASSVVTNNGLSGEIWYVANAGVSGSAQVVTAATLANDVNLTISYLAYGGGAANAPFDKASTGTTNAAGAVSCSSITPVNSGSLSVSFIACKGTGGSFAGTVGTGYTSPDNAGFWWGEHNLSVSTAQIGDWSTNVTQSYILSQALFSPIDIVASGSRLLAATGVGN